MIKEEIQHIRQEYSRLELKISSVAKTPFSQFQTWFNEAVKSSVEEVNAMVLSTVIDKQPSSRIVLLKSFDDNGFVFFTNYESAKGKQMAANPYVALNFFWHELERQVRIEGKIEKTSAEASDRYFMSRPRLSQLGAHASDQSAEVDARETLQHRMQLLEEKYKDKPIPRPKHWGGYVVKPSLVEFWQGRPGRLHDRIVYESAGNDWLIKRLSP